MSELNDKLITYGNLSTFYDKLQEQGLGGNAIEDVTSLPDAGENKSKLIRLESDDNVYVSELKSRTSTTTNRLPDEQQIDKAYWYADGGDIFYYKGHYRIICADGEIEGYGWYKTDEEFWYMYITEDNALNINEDTITYSLNNEEISEIELNTENKVITISEYTINELKDYFCITFGEFPYTLIPATYNAPESAQIGNAYISFNIDNRIKNYYTGEEYSFTYDGITYNGYKWGNYYVSSKPASEIYFNAPEGNQILSDVIFYLIEDDEIGIPYFINIPQLNAPDSEQVGNAYIDTDVVNSEHCIYKGVETTITVDNEDITVYTWEDENNSLTCYSTKRANEIYNTDRDSESVRFYTDDDGIYEISFNDGNLLSISTVKYQRTETTEVWGWEKVAVKEDIKPAIIDKAVPDEVTDTNRGNIYREDDCNYMMVNGYGILPDSEQINEAYFDANLDSYTNFYYKGAFKVICTNGEFEGYGWYGECESFNFLILTETNAVNITDSDTYYNFNTEEMTLNIDWDNHIATASIITEYVNSGTLSELNEFGSITKAEGSIEEWQAIATTNYVDSEIANIDLSDYEKKVDYVIGLSQTTPGAMPTLDLSNLNNVTTDGIYNIAIVSDIYGTGNEYFGTGKLAVQNLGEGNGIQQTLSLVSNYALPKQELIVRAFDGSDWTEQSYPCALIVPQGYEQVVPYATYSATKINELIATKQNTLTSGSNINIVNNVISAVGYIYDNVKISFKTGLSTTATGDYSHAEGANSKATNRCSHAEGKSTTASGRDGSHAEGDETVASGEASHAEGRYCQATALCSHAEGYETSTNNYSEHAEGKNNVSHKTNDNYGNSGNTQHSIGIGTSSNSGKNAIEVMQNGDMYICGLGGYQGTDTKVQDNTIKTLQEVIASLEARIAALEGN